MQYLALGAGLVAGSLHAPKPHIIVVLVDELGTGDVPWEDPLIHAPTIMSLGAEKGLRLHTSYAWHWCAPTRGSLLSGRFPMHTGFDAGGMPGDGVNMPLDVPLLGEDLSRAGYRTHALGKWYTVHLRTHISTRQTQVVIFLSITHVNDNDRHLGFRTPANLPTNRGFDTHFGILGGGSDHYTKTVHTLSTHAKH
jgi:arylsulfatase A-like enzyme